MAELSEVELVDMVVLKRVKTGVCVDSGDDELLVVITAAAVDEEDVVV